MNAFDTLNAEVDRERLCLRPHTFRHTPVWSGKYWRVTFACIECGKKFEGWWQLEQICLGVIGELMLAGEKVPARWTHDFTERVRVARRSWKRNRK